MPFKSTTIFKEAILMPDFNGDQKFLKTFLLYTSSIIFTNKKSETQSQGIN